MQKKANDEKNETHNQRESATNAGVDVPSMKVELMLMRMTINSWN